MDKITEEVVNAQLHAEIWSSSLYIVFQLYFFEQKLPMLASWLDVQIRKKAVRIPAAWKSQCGDKRASLQGRRMAKSDDGFECFVCS